MNINVTSTVFNEGGSIPAKYTCDGENVSPPLEWSEVPEGTKSLVLICDDPDAPMGIWVHWVVYNLPADTRSLPENVIPERTLENGGLQGMNDFGKIGYGGPCPPGGEHRYFFKVYALDTEFELEAGASKSQLMILMEDHVLAEGHLMGRYRR